MALVGVGEKEEIWKIRVTPFQVVCATDCFILPKELSKYLTLG